MNQLRDQSGDQLYQSYANFPWGFIGSIKETIIFYGKEIVDLLPTNEEMSDEEIDELSFPLAILMFGR